MGEVYSSRLRAIALEEGKAMGLDLATGVYACMSGPSYETPAEIKMLRTLGADVVGNVDGARGDRGAPRRHRGAGRRPGIERGGGDLGRARSPTKKCSRPASEPARSSPG